MVLLERIKNFTEACGSRLNARSFVTFQFVEIRVNRRRRLQPPLDSVETRQQHGRKCQIGVGGWIRRAELDTSRSWTVRVCRNPHACAAVARRIHELDWRLVTGYQPPVRVRGRRRESKN